LVKYVDCKYVTINDVSFGVPLKRIEIIDHNANEWNDWNEIYVCAHTTNRRDYRIVNSYPSGPPTGMKFMKIANFKQ